MAYVLDTLHVLNWGVYQGAHDVHFAPGDVGEDRCAVCLTGDTGSGKTTLGDGYLSIMKPRNTDSSYNAASNGGVGAHHERRTTVSYVRGMLGRDASRGDAERMLRPEDVVNSGIVAEFSSDEGSVWCGRLMQHFGPTDSLSQVWVVSDSPVDLRRLNDELGTEELGVRTLSRIFPGAKLFDGVGKYEMAMGASLGIGYDSDRIGSVSRLLAMVQSEKAPSNVDTLFKDYVLESVDVRSRVAATVGTIRGEDERVRSMELIRRHIDTLEELGERWTALDECEARERGLSELVGDGVGARPVDRWASDVRRGMCELEVAHLRERVSEARDDLAAAEEASRVASDAYEEALAVSRASRSEAERAARSGVAVAEGAVRTAQAEMREAQAKVDVTSGRISSERSAAESCRASRDSLSMMAGQKSAMLGAAVEGASRFVEVERPESEYDWEEMVSAVAGFDSERAAKARTELSDVEYELRTARRNRERLLREIEERRNRRTRMGSNFVRVRDEVAEALDRDPVDLPFVGEVVDMREDSEEWRVAANCAFGSVLTRMMVSSDDCREVQRVANAIAARHGMRINYESVNVDDLRRSNASPSGLVSRMEFDETSLFASHAQRMLVALDHICVDDIRSAPVDRNRYVALDGQTMRGRHGSFGRRRDFDCLGFENSTQIEDMESEAEDLANDISVMERERRALMAEIKAFDERSSFAAELRRTSWASVDASVERGRMAELEAEAVARESRVEELVAEREALVGVVHGRAREVEAAEASLATARARLEDVLSESLDDEDGEFARLSAEMQEAIEARGLAKEALGRVEDALASSEADLAGMHGRYRARLSVEATDALTGIVQSSGNDWVEGFLDFDGCWDTLRKDAASKVRSVVRAVTEAYGEVSERLGMCVSAYVGTEGSLRVIEDGVEVADWRYESLSGTAWSDVSSRIAELGLSGLHDSDERDHARLSWAAYYSSELESLVREWGDLDMGVTLRAMCSNSLSSLASLQAVDGTLRRGVVTRVQDVNAILSGISLSDDRDRWLEVVGEVTRDAASKRTFDRLCEFAQLNVDLGTVEVDYAELRHELVEFAGVLAGESERGRRCFLDPKDYVRISFIEHDGDKVTKHVGTGKLSGGEMQQMSACIVGVALLYVMGADAKHGPSFRTVMLDEAFVKSDAEHARDTLRVLMRMGFVPVVAMPPTIVMSVSQCLSRVLFVTKSPHGMSEVHESVVAPGSASDAA